MVFIKNIKSKKQRIKLKAKLVSISSDNVNGSFEKDGKVYFKYLNLALIKNIDGEDKWYNITMYLGDKGHLLEEFPEIKKADDILRTTTTKPLVELEYYETKVVKEKDGKDVIYKNMRMNKNDISSFKVVGPVEGNNIKIIEDVVRNE